MSNLHVIQLVLASAVIFFFFFFSPGVATGGGGFTFWGRRGKCVVCGENGKNTVMKRGAESVTKIFAFEILPYSLIF